MSVSSASAGGRSKGLVALRGLKRGVQQDTQAAGIEGEREYPGHESGADEYPTFR
jgi:hypothetical protein